MVYFNLPGVSLQQYDQAWSDLRAAGYSHPQGLLHHAGAHDGNDLIVVDVWESADAFGKFGETLVPILAKNGMPNVPPTILPLHYEYSCN